MMNGLQISIPQRLTFLRVAIVTFFVLSIVFTWRLWTQSHLFPAAVLLHVDGGNGLQLGLTIAALICLPSSLIFKWYRLLLAVAICCITMLVLMDLNRLQQWVYMYSAILAVLVFYNGRVDDPNRYTSYFIIVQIIICSLYFFKGIHQLQGGFLNELDSAMSSLHSLLSERQYSFCLRAARIIPFIFLFTSVALFVAPLRYLGITLALLMHLCLILLGYPLKSGDVNGYLMNIVMIPVVLLLFSGKTKQRYFSPSFILQRPLFYIVAAAFIIMPFFNNSGRWPDAMSGNVYSGNREKTTIVLPVQSYLALPLPVKRYCFPLNGKMVLNQDKWCRDELGIAYSDSRETRRALLAQIEFWNRGPVKDLELHTTPKRRLLVMP
jgi:hypothetical protein